MKIIKEKKKLRAKLRFFPGVDEYVTVFKILKCRVLLKVIEKKINSVLGI